jgi:lipopolysaccharide transport system permease protein
VGLVPGRLRPVLALNPLTGIIGGFRAALLGQPLPWDLIGIGGAVAVALAASGAFYFRRMERLFADVA